MLASSGRHARSSFYGPHRVQFDGLEAQTMQDSDGLEQAIAREVGVGSDDGGIQAALLRSGLERSCAK